MEVIMSIQCRLFRGPEHIDVRGKEMDRKRFESKGRIEVRHVPDPNAGFRVGAIFMKHEYPYMLRDKCFQAGTILFNHATGQYETVRPYVNQRGRVSKHVTTDTSPQELAKAGIL
jgi:hypothetical protein